VTTDREQPTIASLRAETELALGDAAEARWICEVAFAHRPLTDILHERATDRMVAHLDAMVARRRSGEPLQYVLGEWSFRRLDLAVDRRVLIPRPETEWVAGRAIELALAIDGDRLVVDLGTGSGAIGLAMADELPLDGTSVWLTDADPEALAVARANLAGIGRAARNVTVAEGRWFSALPAGLRADVIVSNPPYVAVGDPALDADVLDWEPAQALFAGSDGLDDLREIIAGASAHLRPGGWLVCEIGAGQAAAVTALARSAGLIEVSIEPDPAGHDRMLVARSAQ
jgi:release factor glutamine methyltransferase